MKQKKFVLIFLIFISIFFNFAQSNIPKPTNFYRDDANVLNQEHKYYIKKINEVLKRNSGAEIAIYTINELENKDTFTFSVKIFENWKPGLKEKDNGILILFVKNDNKIEVRTGYGVEGFLPDGKIGRYLDKYFIPLAKKNQYGRGLVNLTYILGLEIANENGFNLKEQLKKGTAAKTPKNNSDKKEAALPVGIIILFVILYIFPPTRPFAIMLLFMFLRRGGASGSSGFGGGFGGFGGGSTGGGGAGRSW